MLAALLAFSMAIPTNQVAVVPKSGLQIAKSARLKPGTYRLTSKSEEIKDAAIVIRGNNLVVDFKGVILEGTPQTAQPDKRHGLGVYVEGENVTIKNARIRGYKVALMAKNSPSLRILDSDFSYNWKQHLNSTPDREDGGDWMSYHHNEKDEWLRYGAGMYLQDCKSFEVKGCRVNGGQNALMMTSCDDGKVWNNDFSFNSSLGIGMYRSSNNKIMHNKIDWCVRGFSYGKYNRGQDSAGILVYEQSNKNVFAYNSVTHGGDGFFLWAGQTTMDTGKGGCNDNLLYGNDFSHAPTNGIEATFSRNAFVNNLILECWHGIWGGYSYETRIVGNTFGNNAEAIAIEHGQDNSILGNTFTRDHDAINLWANDGAPDPNWGYPKHRDTRNRNTTIDDNVFTDTQANAFRIRNGIAIQAIDNEIRAVGKIGTFGGNIENVTLAGNRVQGSGLGTMFPLNSAPPNSNNAIIIEGPYARTPLPPASALNQGQEGDLKEYLDRFVTGWNPYQLPEVAKTNDGIKSLVVGYRPAPLEGGTFPFLPSGGLRGWRYMFVDEWGPYDFKRPMLYPREEGPNGERTFELIGPSGIAKIVEKKGVIVESISKNGKEWLTPDAEITSIPAPGFVRIKISTGKATDALLTLEYRGEQVVDHRGIVIPKGKPFRFGWSKFEAPIDWQVRWYAWDKAAVPDPKAKMPTPGSLLSKTELRTPIAEARTTKLDFVTGGSPHNGVPNDHFITMAEGAFEIAPGNYEVAATADDGIRLWLDDKLIIDQWHWQGPTRYAKVVKLGGKHRLRLEHYEIDGYTALKIEVAPKR